MSEYLKSIKAILYDRVTSPFYGTLIISWLIWNWKIPYVTFFISENKLTTNKIDYIFYNCNSISHLIIYPIISVIILLTIMPFITNGAYWLTLKFDQWRYQQKINIENKLVLTVEQSLSLRMELREQEEKFENILKNKNLELQTKESEIKFLSDQISQLKNNIEKVYVEKQKLIQDTNNESSLRVLEQIQFENEYNEFKKTKYFKYINLLNNKIQNSNSLPDESITSEILTYFLVNSYISRVRGQYYEYTKKGLELLKHYLNDINQA